MNNGLKYTNIIGFDAGITDYSVKATPEQWQQIKTAFLEIAPLEIAPHYKDEIEKEKWTLNDPALFKQYNEIITKIAGEPTQTPGGTIPNIFYNMRGALLDAAKGKFTLYGTADAKSKAALGDTKLPIADESNTSASLIVNIKLDAKNTQKRTATNPGNFKPRVEEAFNDGTIAPKQGELAMITGSVVSRLGLELGEKIIDKIIASGAALSYNLPTSYPKDAAEAGALRLISDKAINNADYVFTNITELLEHHGRRNEAGKTFSEEELYERPAGKEIIGNALKMLQAQMKQGAEAVITAGQYGAYVLKGGEEGYIHLEAQELTGKDKFFNCAGDTTIGIYLGLRQFRNDLTPEDSLNVAMNMARFKISNYPGRIEESAFKDALSNAFNDAKIYPVMVQAKATVVKQEQLENVR